LRLAKAVPEKLLSGPTSSEMVASKRLAGRAGWGRAAVVAGQQPGQRTERGSWAKTGTVCI